MQFLFIIQLRNETTVISKNMYVSDWNVIVSYLELLFV